VKYANTEEMTTAHVQDVVDTVDPASYQNHINAAFEAVLRMMISAHENNLHFVMRDIAAMADHYIGRCVTVIKEHELPEGTTIH
jgi:bisphosphoglycerate-dependent phosphoglycerate mutase